MYVAAVTAPTQALCTNGVVDENPKVIAEELLDQQLLKLFWAIGPFGPMDPNFSGCRSKNGCFFIISLARNIEAGKPWKTKTNTPFHATKMGNWEWTARLQVCTVVLPSAES